MRCSMQNAAPVPDRNNWSKMFRGRNFRRWTCRWRTILLSSLGKTLYPYSQFIQTLDLVDLQRLLKESRLSDITSK